MHLIINHKKLKIKKYSNFKDKFKSLKFIFEPINYGVKLTNKKLANTYFFVQRVDICFTDSDNRIIGLIDNVSSEKLKIMLSAANVYYFPINTNKELKIGEILKEKD